MYLSICSFPSNFCHILYIQLECRIIPLIISDIFDNALDQETVSGNILTQITGDFPQFLIVKHAGIAYKNLSYSYHDFSKLNIDRFQRDFANLDLTYLNDDKVDTNSKFNRFLSNLDKLVKTHAPLKNSQRQK